MKLVTRIMSIFASLALLMTSVFANGNGTLAGTSWRLVAIDGVELGDTVVTLFFGRDGSAGGYGGCNSYGGDYTETGNTLGFVAMFSTMMACEDTLDTEISYLNALATAARFQLSADNLVIETSEGAELVFVPFINLNGTQWQLVSLNGQPALGDSSVTIGFDEGQAGGSSGCNSYGGSYYVSGDTLSFSELASTLMACLTEGVMEQESAYLAVLSTVTAYRYENQQLVLVGEGGELVFMLTLTGTSWQLNAINGEALVEGTTITLNFDENDLNGSAGCNRYSGGFSIEGNTITVSPIAGTRMACAEPIMSQEFAYLQALQAAVSVTVSNGELTLSTSDGATLIFVAAR